MAILVRCPNPNCANHAAGKAVPDRLAGTTIRCKLCGQGARVPSPDAEGDGSKNRWLLIGGGAAGVLLLALVVVGIVFTAGSGTPPPNQVAANGNTAPQTPDQPPAETGTPTSVQKTNTTAGENTKTGTTTVPKTETGKTPPADDSKISRLIPFEKIEGFDKLEKVKVFQVNGTAQFSKSSNTNDVSIAWHSNSRFKFLEHVNNPGNKISITILMKDAQSWVNVVSQVGTPITKELFGKELGDSQNEAYSYIFSNLALLKEKEKEFDFFPEKDQVIKERECFSIRAARKGQPEMRFFFDKRSNRVMKVQYQANFTLFETYYSDYHESKGIFYWRKMEQHRNGQPHGVLTINTINFHNQFDEGMFSLN